MKWETLTPPFYREDGKIMLQGCVMMSCGCGNVTSRWATLRQSLPYIPETRPKASQVATEWLKDHDMFETHPILKNHQYGVVVGETSDGIELVDFMGGVTHEVISRIKKLIEDNKSWNRQSSAS